MGERKLDDWKGWKCKDCNYVDRGPVDTLVGKCVEVEVEEGGETKTVETVVCPNCESENWYSDLRDGIHRLGSDWGHTEGMLLRLNKRVEQ